MWLAATTSLGAVTTIVAATESADPTVFYQYGAIGVGLVVLGMVARVLYSRLSAVWEARFADLKERLKEATERAERAETQLTELNRVVQKEVLDALTESQRAVRDAISEIRQR